MPDEESPSRPAAPEPASDAKKHAGKRVVLSSVAKVAPVNESESLLGEPEPAKGGPPELPPKTSDGGLIRPVGWTTRPGGTTTIIKLPPKTGTLPRMTSLSQQAQEAAPLPPPTEPADGGDEARRPPPIKLIAPVASAQPDQESILAPPTDKLPEPKAPVVEVKPPPIVSKAAPAEIKVKPIEPAAPVPVHRATPPPLPMRPPPAAATVKPPAAAPAKTPAPAIPGKPDPHHVMHVPPLVAHDAAAPESVTEALLAPSATPPRNDPFAQTVKLSPAPSAPAALPPTQTQLPLADAPNRTIPGEPRVAEAKGLEATAKHRLPPRSSATGRLRRPLQPAPPPPLQKIVPPVTPPKVFPPVVATAVPIATAPAIAAAAPPPLARKAQAVKSTVTPPTIPLGPGRIKPPTIPLKPAPARAPISPLLREDDDVPEKEEVAAPSSRAARKRRRRTVGIVVFYVLLVVLMPLLYFGALYFSRETRVEGQVIPPPGMLLTDEVWIVTDFRDLATGIADDLASDRQIVLQDMQEKLGHVQRAQADVATREARIRLLKDQIQADNDEEMSLMKQARDASQQIWNGPGAQLEVDYQSRLTSLDHAIRERAQANRLQYDPDPNFYSPEVWANAYRLALYEVPKGVDALKERAWLDGQMKAWHDFTKAMDLKQAQLREQATQLKLAPASKVADIKSQVDDLQQRIDATIAEEEPLKAELEQARGDFVAVQTKEAGLDGKPYENPRRVAGKERHQAAAVARATAGSAGASWRRIISTRLTKRSMSSGSSPAPCAPTAGSTGRSIASASPRTRPQC